MKRCPECRRDYYDDTLLYCLDDGNALLEGPASAKSEPPASAGAQFDDEPQTAILSVPPAIAGGQSDEAKTRAFIQTTQAAAEPRGRLSSSWAKLLIAAAAVVVLLGGFFGYRYLNQNVGGQINSIAVMPFSNETGDPTGDYLSDGMAETLMNSLAQVPGLSVKARSSVSRFEGKDAETIGRELSVQAVLNGRLVKGGEDLSVFIELVDAATGDRLWGEQYNRPSSGLVTLQNDIARDVSRKLKAKLSGADQQKITKSYTENAEAYKLYLQGRFFWNKRTARDINESIGYFEQARDRDPSFALAYIGIADAYAQLSTYGGAVPRDSMQKAKEAVLRALSLDPELAEAHATLGQILHGYDYDFAGAERELQRAIELNPKYPPAHQWLSEVLAAVGRTEESMAAVRNALEVDPTSPILNRMYAMNLFYARRMDESLAQINKTLEFDQNFSSAHYSLGMILLAQNKIPESAEAFARHWKLNGVPMHAETIRKSIVEGGRERFLRTMAETTRLPNSPNYQSAKFYAALGSNDKAFESLNRAYDDREFSVTWLKRDPAFDALREDPRFQENLKKVGFPQDR